MSAVRVVLWESLPNNRGVAVQDVTCAECSKFGPFSDRAGWCSYWMSSTVGKTPCAAWKPRQSVGIGDNEGTP